MKALEKCDKALGSRGKLRYRFDRKRGRSSGRHRSQADNQLLEYLAKVSIKYKVDSDELFKSLPKVYQHGKCMCGELSIQCRLREQDEAVFLITKGWKIVGQFRISRHLLYEKINPLGQFVSELSVTRVLSQEVSPKNCKIRDLRVGMRRLNINAQVLKVSQPIQITTRSGLCANLAIALIADETGTVNLSLFGSQIKEVALHNFIQIENAYVARFRGELQLRIGRRGKISVLSPDANNIKMTYPDHEKTRGIIQK